MSRHNCRNQLPKSTSYFNFTYCSMLTNLPEFINHCSIDHHNRTRLFIMGNCLGVEQKGNEVKTVPNNPYFETDGSEAKLAEIYPYLQENHQPWTAKDGASLELAEKDRVIMALRAKVESQNNKLNEIDKSMRELSKRAQPNDPYQGQYCYGKQNILNWQSICTECKPLKMQRFLDFSGTRPMCKCEGYGVVAGDKIKKKCSQWFCGHKVKVWLICPKCYGQGFKPTK